MASSEPASFPDHFQDLNDPRVERTRKHPLINIVFIAVCGVLSGANSFAGIHEFAPEPALAPDDAAWARQFVPQPG